MEDNYQSNNGKAKRSSNLWIGLIFIFGGGVVLLNQMGLLPFELNWWALFILMPAAGFLSGAYNRFRANETLFSMDVEWLTETEHEISFREDIIELLVADGYKRENVSLAWMEFKEPKPVEIIPQFMENGIEKLLFFSAAISADAIHSQYDNPELVYEYEFPEGFPVLNLGALE